MLNSETNVVKLEALVRRMGPRVLSSHFQGSGQQEELSII